MTHFIGAVIVPSNVPFLADTKSTKYPELYGEDAREVTPAFELGAYLTLALDRFDENKIVERWIPKSELIAKQRESIEAYRATIYAEYLKDPEAYAEERGPNSSHVEYLRDEFPQRLKWTDEQVYAYLIDGEHAEDIREDGAVRDTYNPESKWDWWVIGGRWEKIYRDRQGETVDEFRAALLAALEASRVPENIAAVQAMTERIKALQETMREQSRGEKLNLPIVTWQDIEALREQRADMPGYFPWWTPYNIVVPVENTFEWVSKGDMGWFGASNDKMTDEQWVEQLIALLEKQDPEARIVYIDFHI